MPLIVWSLLDNFNFGFSSACLQNFCFIAEEGGSWDIVNENDLWEGGISDPDQENYVLVRQEDIVEGIACFMAAYLLSLKQTKVWEISELIALISFVQAFHHFIDLLNQWWNLVAFSCCAYYLWLIFLDCSNIFLIGTLTSFL